MRYNVLAAFAAIVVGATVATSQSPAPIAYPRYVRPGQCVQAALRLYDRYWRDKRADTIVYARTEERVPASVIDSAKTCAARFSVASLPERDLLGMVRLSLWTQQDDVLHAAMTRLADAQRGKRPRERGWILQELVSSFLDARPARPADAARVLAQLDSMGVVAAEWRMGAHVDMSRFLLDSGDISAARAHGAAAVAAIRAMSRNDRADYAFAAADAFNVLAQPQSVIAGGPAAVAVLDTALQEVGSLWEGMRGMQLKGMLQEMQQPYGIIGKPAPAFHVTHWYGRADSTALPEAGAVTLLVNVNGGCGGYCFNQYAVFRRLAARYEARGVRIVAIGQTVGFFRLHPEPVPAHEAEQIRAYVRDYLKLPGTLGVDEIEFSNIADGRRVDRRSKAQSEYFLGGRSAVVIGRDGLVRMSASLYPQNERLLAGQLEAALAK